MCLYSDDELEDSRKDQLRNALSYVVSVATQLTQQEYYKANFVKVLDRVLVSEHKDGNSELKPV